MATIVPKADNLLRIPVRSDITNSVIIDTEGYATCWVYLEWLADAASAAGDTVGLRWLVDPNSLLAYPIPTDETAASGIYLPTAIGLGSTGAAAPVTMTASAFAPGVAAGNFFALYQDPPAFLQVNVTRSAAVVPNRYLLSVFGRAT